MEQAGGGSATRGLATPETVAQSKNNDDEKQEEAPSGKEAESAADKKLPEDQEAMQPDSS